MNDRASRVFLLGLLAACFVAGGLQAAGFSFFEQSAKASAMGGAWVARADDAAANWYNPAALVWLDKSQFQLGINAVQAGDVTLTADDPDFGIFAPTKFKAKKSTETPIHLYYASRIGDRAAFGIGLNTPFGLKSSWKTRPITYSAMTSELQTFVVNPNFAYKLGDNFSVAVGIDYMFADVKEFSREVPIDLDGNPFNGFEIIGNSNLSGDGDDWGWNLALHYKADRAAFGLIYRSALSPKIDGKATFRDFSILSPLFPEGPGSTKLSLPDNVVGGVSWGANDPWSFEFDVSWMRWSSFDEIAIDFENNSILVQDLVLREDWNDAFSYRFGGAYRSSQRNEWRFGGFFDETPVPTDTLRPSIPDSDRWVLTLGYGYMGERFDIDLYYNLFLFDTVTAVGDEDGVINGTYDATVNILGVTFSVNFG